MTETTMDAGQHHNISLGVMDKLQRYALRSGKQLIIHTIVAILLAVAFALFARGTLTVSSGSLAGVMSSMVAVSGALLAVTIALAQFFGTHVTNWRDGLIGQLRDASARARVRMEEWAHKYPEIPRHLARLYDMSLLYVPGKPLDVQQIKKEQGFFLEWVRETIRNENPAALDPGGPHAYDSLSIHLRDAIVCEHELGYNLIMLDVVARHMKIIRTFSPLILGWLIVLLLTLTSAVLVVMGTIGVKAGAVILVVPSWLFLVAIFALVKDITALLTILGIEEIAWEMAKEDLANEPKTTR